MNAQQKSAGGLSEGAPVERKRERICWPCIFAALPPLLLTLFVGWFVVSALERGREISGAQAAVSAGTEPRAPVSNTEAEDDGAFFTLQLQEDLEAANQARAEAEAKLKALQTAGAQEQEAALQALRSELSKALEKVRIRDAEAIEANSALATLRDEIKLRDQGVATAAGALASAEAKIDELAARLAAKADEGATAAKEGDELAQTKEALAASEKKLSDLRDRFALESAALGEAEKILAELKAEKESEEQSARAREATLIRERDDAIAKIDDAVESAVKASAAVKQAQQRETRLKAQLERARAGLSRGIEEKRASSGTAPDTLGFLDGVSSLAASAREKAYAEIGSELFRAPEFQSWLASEDAKEARASLASVFSAAGPAPDAGSETTGADAKLEEAEAALTEAEETLKSALRLRAEAEKDVKQLAARLASREARILRLEASANEAIQEAEAAAKAHKEELQQLSEQLAAAKKAAEPPARDPATSAANAEKSARILELEKALAAAPKPETVAALEKKLAALQAQGPRGEIDLKEAVAAKAAAKAALARLAERAKGVEAETARTTESAPGDSDGGALTKTLVDLPEVGEVPAAEAREAVQALLAKRDDAVRQLTAALTAAQLRRASEAAPSQSSAETSASLSLPQIGDVTLEDAPKAVGDLFAAKESEARGLRAANATLQARLAAVQSGSAASGGARTGAGTERIVLPEIGPIEPAKAPEEVVKLLAVRDRSLKAALTENVALKAKLALVERPASGEPAAATKPRKGTDGAAAAAVYPKWREAPLQAVAGVELNVLSSPIAFDSASADLTKDGRKAVRKLARQLLKSLKKAPNEQWRLVIEGHSDQRPIRTRDFASNWDLSSARAAAVAWELQKQGVPSSRLLAVGRAASDPLDARWTRSAFALNRRIELSLLRRGGRSRAEEK